MGLQFSLATEKEIHTIKTLAHKIWREHYPSIISEEQIEYMLKSNYSAVAIAEQMKTGEQFFIVSEDFIPIAYASVGHKAGGYFLHKFYVAVAEHRKGIGTKFFDFILSQLPEGMPIRLQVNRQNYKAINFYFKIGFVIESIGDFDIGSGHFMNDFVMVRD